jgi:hypothetical protein
MHQQIASRRGADLFPSLADPASVARHRLSEPPTLQSGDSLLRVASHANGRSCTVPLMDGCLTSYPLPSNPAHRMNPNEFNLAGYVLRGCVLRVLVSSSAGK